MKITIQQIAKAIGAEIKGCGKNIYSHMSFGASIDTRSLKKGDVFFAINGENADGHAYVSQAFKKGAAACVVKKGWKGVKKTEGLLFCVKNPQKALWDMASFYRSLLKARVIAITGSNGKTTCKDMIGAILAGSKYALVSEGNLNNHLGVPLMILRAMPEHRILVLELGTNHFGEISRLSRLAMPDIGVITAVGESHLEFFRTINNVAKEKMEIVHGMKKGGALVLNGDSPYLRNITKIAGIKMVTYGSGSHVKYRFSNLIVDNRRIRFKIGREEFSLSILGRHNAYNATAAFVVGRLLGYGTKVIKNRLKRFKPRQLRMEIIRKRNIIILNDCYNANPPSMAAALQTFKSLNVKGKRIAVLGDMFELGSKSASLHYQVGLKYASGLDRIFLFGEKTKELCKGAFKNGFPKIYVAHFSKSTDLIRRLICTVESGDAVLIKGSRGMKMENITVELLNFLERGNHL
ncbi:MAG: UDP-N-acetylmuramoyl-tripeptide--D-alanyl-D-alanine ligase [Elusimicrobiota bacterium]